MAGIHDLNPVSHITVGTIGQPGERVFYLQAERASELITLIIEKEHALALVSSLDDLLAELDARFPRPTATIRASLNMGLREPIEPLFRVGQIGLGYDESAELVVLIAYEVAISDDQEDDTAVVRLWGKREQMRMLRNAAIEAVEGGRPTCTLCGELIETDGHLCPRRNGHGNSPKFAS